VLSGQKRTRGLQCYACTPDDLVAFHTTAMTMITRTAAPTAMPMMTPVLSPLLLLLDPGFAAPNASSDAAWW
jgi:hypothetical protein